MTPKSRLERGLSIFTDVKASEGTNAILLTFNIFLILAAYYLIRNVRQTLILTEGELFGFSGAEVAAYSSAGQAVLLFLVVPFYGWLASRIPRIPLITATILFFASNLVVFSVLGRAGVREGAVFYIWVGVFNVFVIAQFWSFANDLYTEAQGKRLFPLIGVGQSAGAGVGALVIFPLVGRFQFTPYTLMILAGALLIWGMSRPLLKLAAAWVAFYATCCSRASPRPRR